jgi:hypothetical protein
MALQKGSKVERGYATVAEEEGENYREIADTMTELGHPMNHSSARNYVLRAMRKFAIALMKETGVELNEEEILRICKSPNFQYGISDLLHHLESKRRSESTEKNT